MAYSSVPLDIGHPHQLLHIPRGVFSRHLHFMWQKKSVMLWWRATILPATLPTLSFIHALYSDEAVKVVLRTIRVGSEIQVLLTSTFLVSFPISLIQVRCWSRLNSNEKCSSGPVDWTGRGRATRTDNACHVCIRGGRIAGILTKREVRGHLRTISVYVHGQVSAYPCSLYQKFTASTQSLVPKWELVEYNIYLWSQSFGHFRASLSRSRFPQSLLYAYNGY